MGPSQLSYAIRTHTPIGLACVWGWSNHNDGSYVLQLRKQHGDELVLEVSSTCWFGYLGSRQRSDANTSGRWEL